MHLRLVPLFAPTIEEAVIVRGPRFIIGRAADCDLCLCSPIVSRRHCELILNEREVRVRDLESSNGTFVNKQPVMGEQVLNDGDVLAIVANIYRAEIYVHGSAIDLLSHFGRSVVGALH